MSTASVPEKTNRMRSGIAAFCSSVFHGILAWPAWQALAVLYFFFTLLRIVLAFAITTTPVIMPDSALYMHLSHSIFDTGELLFRGQPIRYAYILYPIFLLPLHLLPESVSFFRAVQVYNAFVMHLAVFPAYGLARLITRDHGKGLLVALMTLLMPDFMMVEHVMAESLAFPLIITACYVFYKQYDNPARPLTILLWGGLGYLLYTVKPGYIALPACFLALQLWDGLRSRNASRLFGCVACLLSMLAFHGLFTLLLRFGLHMSHTQSTLYGSQTHPLSWDHLLQTFNGLVMYGAFVPLAFGFLPLYLPASHLSAFTGRDRRIVQTVLLSILLLVIGTVYVIYYDELNGTDPYTARIHVRYVCALLPVLMAFLLSPDLAGKKMNTALFAFVAFSFLFLIRRDGSALNSGYSYPVDALLLTAATTKTQGFNGGLLWPIAALLLLGVMAYRLFSRGFLDKERRFLCGFLIISFIFNNTLAFSTYRYHSDSIFPAEAREAVKMAGTADALAVVRDGACFWPEAASIDVASRCALPMVELDDLIAHTNEDGSLSSFVPSAYWQEDAVNAIPMPQKLILTGDILYQIILAEDTVSGAVSTPQKGYVVADVHPGSPWIHSGLSGLNEGWVQAGSRFTLYDAQLLQKGQITLQLQCRAGEGQAQLILACGGQERSHTLSAELGWITAAFSVEDPAKPLTITLANISGNVLIQTYLVE